MGIGVICISQVQASAFPVYPQIVPWNQFRSALSLTFDDSNYTPLSPIIRSLKRGHLLATFFLITNHVQWQEESQWRNVLADGNELGSGSLNGNLPGQRFFESAKAQVWGGLKVLENMLGVPLYVFAYPHFVVTPSLETWVRKKFLFGRGLGPPNQSTILWNSSPNWSILPSIPISAKSSLASVQNQIVRSERNQSWILLAFQRPFRPLTIWWKQFARWLQQRPQRSLWIEPMGRVGVYLWANDCFRHAIIQNKQHIQIWKWKVPKHFPPHEILKMRLITKSPRINLNKVQIFQNHQRLVPNRAGVYSLWFNLKNMVIRLPS